MAEISLQDAFGADANGIYLGDLAIVQKRLPAMSLAAAGWYNVAKYRPTVYSSGTLYHPTGLFAFSGIYQGHLPSKGIFAFSLNGGQAGANIKAITSILCTNPKRLRIRTSSASSAEGAGVHYIDMYFDAAFNNNGLSFAVAILNATQVEIFSPVAVADTPTGDTVRATLNIATTS